MKMNSIKRDEVLRYLGYHNQEIDEVIHGLIDEAMKEILLLAKERYIYKSFDIYREGDEIYLDGSRLILSGSDIEKHLSKSIRCVLIGATLGHDVDTKIRYYEKVDMAKALILDACATATIEELCDRICDEIQCCLDEGKKLTSRFSPGYGDLPIQIQSDFLLTLDAKKSIGLTSSGHSILIPRKSVTAIVGIIDKSENIENIGCEKCNKFSTCNYRKGGQGCAY